MKQFLPTYYAPKLTEVTPAFFHALGVTTLLCDLDNTLAPFDELTPRPAIKTWLETIQKSKLTIAIISNNKPRRVLPFANAIGVESLTKTGKPFSNKLLKFIQEKGYSIDKVMVIGDQLLTDVWLANRLGIKSLFVEKLVPYDHWPTKPNRLIEGCIKKRLLRHHQLRHWEDRT